MFLVVEFLPQCGKSLMTKVVEKLPVNDWPADPSDIDKYYEIPTVKIPELTGLNVLIAEEISIF